MTETTPTQPIAEWIDEIPTEASARKALVVSVATGMLAGLGFLIWKFGPPALAAFFDRNANAAILLQDNGLASVLAQWCTVFGVLGAVCGVCGGRGRGRRGY